MSEFSITVTSGKASVYTPFNRDFVDKIKLMGARWNPAARCWQVDECIVPDVREAMRSVYGRDDQPVAEVVDVELTFDESVCEGKGPVTILGRIVASAWGRDTGARVGDGVMFVKGRPDSGGSRAHWETYIPAGCVVKLLKVPKMATEDAELPAGVSMRIIGGGVDREALEEERRKLLARIAEIDELLND